MTEVRRLDDEVSIVALATTVLRHRWRVVAWALVGAAVFVVPVLFRPAVYRASVSFTPQATEAGRSGLAGLAGQLGVTLPTAGSSQSPDFYSSLLKSRELLGPIARDTFVVQEMNGQRLSFDQLFMIKGESAARREELGVELLAEIVTTSMVKTTGVVELSVATRWPSVSLAIVRALVDGLNNFNQRTRQGQAAAERRFLEGRLAVAQVDLRAAEDRLGSFLRANREFGGSSELTFQRDRLQRAVQLQQQVFTSLTQSYEDARVREVRDTPLITVIESPSVPTRPLPRGRAKRGLLGLLLGGMFGALAVLASGAVARRRQGGDSEMEGLAGAVSEAAGDVSWPIRWLRGRVRR